MKKYFFILFITLPIALVADRGFGGPGMGRGTGNCFWSLGHWYIPGGGINMWIVWMIVLVVLGLTIYKVFTLKNLPKGENETSLDIARKRYAKGEIKKDEFEQLKKDLQ